MIKPMISVIIPTFNSSRFIRETVASVLSQSILELEVVVVDDGSTDGTLDIIQNMIQEDARIRYFVQGHKGVSVARNKGIKESVGDYIAFLDHDDLWIKNKLEKQLPLFKSDSQIGLVFSRAAILIEGTKSRGLVGGIALPRRGYIFKEYLSQHFIPVSTAIVKREIFSKFDEWFPESMEMAEELDLFLRILYYWKADYCDEILAKWRMHPFNDSRMRKGLLIKDYQAIFTRMKKIVPNFEEQYGRELFEKKRWMAIYEIEILLSQNRKLAFKKMGLFIRNYGFYPKAIMKLVMLFSLGIDNYERIRLYLLDYCSRFINTISQFSDYFSIKPRRRFLWR